MGSAQTGELKTTRLKLCLPTEADGSALADRLAALVGQVPGATERELTDLLYGDAAGPGRLTFWCHLLLNRGVIERSGAGGKQDPYRYRLAGAA